MKSNKLKMEETSEDKRKGSTFRFLIFSLISNTLLSPSGPYYFAMLLLMKSDVLKRCPLFFISCLALLIGGGGTFFTFFFHCDIHCFQLWILKTFLPHTTASSTLSLTSQSNTATEFIPHENRQHQY